MDGIAVTEDGEIVLKKANQSAVINKVLDPTNKLFVVTDTQGTKIEKFLNTLHKVGFLINSETSANYLRKDGSRCSGETWRYLFDRIPLAKERYESLIDIEQLDMSWVGELMTDRGEFIKKYQPDYIIGSPSIMAGFSVVLPKYFSCIVGLFCGVLGTQGLSQILFRLRDNEIPTYVSIPERGLFPEQADYYDNDLGKLLNERRTELAAEFENEDAVDIILNARKRINPTWEHRSLLAKGIENFEKSNYRSCLRYALEHKGHIVEFETSDTRPDITHSIKEIGKEEKIQKAFEIFNATEYVGGYDEAKQVHERLETIATARALTKARILDRLPSIKDTSIWSEAFILECYLKNRNFIKQQETFHFVHNPDISKKKLEMALYNTATAEFVDGESLERKDYHIIKALRSLGIPELIKKLENGLEISKKSPEVIEIVQKARRKDVKAYRLAGLIPGRKTEEQKENLKFIKQLLKLVGVYLTDKGRVINDGVREYIYGLDFAKFNSDYRTVVLDCVNICSSTWEAEKYQTDKPNWEYTKETGQRAPKAIVDDSQATTSIITEVIETVTVFVDQAQKILIETFSPMLRAIAKQIKETGSVAARALEGLDVIQLLAIQDIVEELSGT